jgi:UDP-N-acetylglucosamine--N-acetylmuramyl-(pentapeptide) pyrophosphoryl-undecaprenol N-acetylglucosamine transferase
VRVVIGTGGTAGHIFPALATAERLRDGIHADVLFVGRDQGQEAAIVPAAGFPLETVEALPFVRKLSPAMLRAPATALRAARRCRSIVRGADVVLGMGGYVSVPVSLAARWERVPLVLHEQNAVPGLANRVAARWARVVALAFGEAARRLPRRAHTVVTGNPVRERIVGIRERRMELLPAALEAFGLRSERRTVVLFGGSQGALRLNRAAAGACGLLARRRDLQVLLITGPAHEDAVRADLPGSGSLEVRVLGFAERMELVYAVADLMVARAGATTVAEISVCGLPALLVPYPHATGRHQEANARALERSGGAAVVADQDLTPQLLAERIEALIDHRERLDAMARASASFGRPHAADDLARLAAKVGAGARR